MQFIYIEVHIENCKKKKKNILHLAASSLVFASGNPGFPKIVKAIFSTNTLIFKLIYLGTYRPVILVLTLQKISLLA